jgi:hypothetical protein
VANEEKPVEEETQPMPVEPLDDAIWQCLFEHLQLQQEASPLAAAHRKSREEDERWQRALEHSQRQEDPEEPREGPSGRGGRRR